MAVAEVHRRCRRVLGLLSDADETTAMIGCGNTCPHSSTPADWLPVHRRSTAISIETSGQKGLRTVP